MTPFDVVKTRMQTSIKQQPTSTFTSMFNIIQHEKLSALWRGLSPTLLMSVPSTIIYYIGYESLRDYISPQFKRFGLEAYTPIVAGSSARYIYYYLN